MQNLRVKPLFIALILSHFLISKTFAVAAGAYFGLMTGPSSNTATMTEAFISPTETTTVFPKQSLWGTRLFTGYKFNDFSAIELGLSYFSDVRFVTHDDTTPCGGGAKARVRAVDFTGRASYPIYGVEPYLRGGFSYTYLYTSGSFYPPPTNKPENCGGASQSQFNFRPTFTIGIGYDLTPNVVVDVSATRLMVGNLVKNIDFYALGFSYHMVNRYCGQFLCDD